MHPVRVYDDHGNTVVVQKMVDGIESGKYIVPLVSSWIPFRGEGGFTLVLGTGYINKDLSAVVYEYLKRQPSGPADGSQPIRSETNRTSSAAGSRR